MDQDLAEGPRCAVCADPVGADPFRCPRCQVAYHRDCWDYAGECSIFGCDPSRVLPARPAVTPPSRASQLGGWMLGNTVIMAFPVLCVALGARDPVAYLGVLVVGLVGYWVIQLVRPAADPEVEEPEPEGWIKTRMLASGGLFLANSAIWLVLLFLQLAVGSLLVASDHRRRALPAKGKDLGE